MCLFLVYSTAANAELPLNKIDLVRFSKRVYRPDFCTYGDKGESSKEKEDTVCGIY